MGPTYPRSGTPQTLNHYPTYLIRMLSSVESPLKTVGVRRGGTLMFG